MDKQKTAETTGRAPVSRSIVEFAKSQEGCDLDAVIARTSGYLNYQAEEHPNTTYSVEEVKDLFGYLFDLLIM